MNAVKKISWLMVVVLSLTIAVGIASAAWLTDSGTVDVQVADNTTSQVDKTTAQGAFVSYFGDLDTTFGSSGTGTFDPFVRLQGSPTEQGYNTNGVTEFDTKAGTWTHAILVSRIPQRPCPQTNPSLTCFELFVDINDNNSTPYISLNKVEVYFTDSATLTGYPFSGSATTSAQYKFNGDVLIHDVNQGSGRADLRYDIPINDPSHPITLPSNCDYGNPLCSTYFVLYSKWGTSTLASPDGNGYGSDGGFEEWKVKVYPAIKLSKTPSTTDVCNGSNAQVTFTYVVTNTGTSTVSGTVVDDNGTPGNTADDVNVGTYSGLAAGASVTFTHVFTINGTRTNVATSTATDTNGVTATASATATVNGHNCTISITKTPSVTNVCNGSNTQITYTYVVTNNSDFYSFSGTVTDDKLGAIGPVGPLAPGASATLTKVATVNATTTNTGTASGKFNDSVQTSASATASATVTGHTCTISITKTPSTTSVCNNSNTQVTYTYVVKNTGDFFSVSGSVTDDKLGSIGPFGPLAPGASATLTKSATINGTTTNTGTANGTFTDSTSTTASASASATVTGHTCTISITKTPSTTSVCNGSNTPVTYTYVVKNTGDFFSVSGSVTDDVLGSIGPFGPLAPGASATLTKTATVNGTTTNTGTATGTFSDSTPTTASASATATVTGHNCTLSITKTPSTTSVCNNSNTQVTYTYVVKNTGDFFNVSGSVTDDKLGSIGPFGPLAPGASATLTKSATINGTTTNTGTATGTFDDSTFTSVSATASATVTGHNCTITFTKTPSRTTVCNGSNTPVTYTYVVTNNSDIFTFSGSVTDDKLGSIGSFGPLAPGASQTLTKTATISGTVTNTGTVTGTFSDSTPTSATATASATVNGVNCAQITPTNTTCSSFSSGTAATLDSLLYSVKSGTINSVSPGVFFYWIGVQAAPGANSFTIHQAITTGNFDSHFFSVASGSNAFDSTCTAINGTSITQNGADVTVTFNSGGGGTVYLGIKYDATSVKGFAPPSGTGTAHYTFEIFGQVGSQQGLDLKKK